MSSAVSQLARLAPRAPAAFAALCLLVLALLPASTHADAPPAAPVAPMSVSSTPMAATPHVDEATALCPASGNLLRTAVLTASGITGARPQVNNGVLALEGSLWNAADAVVLATTDSALDFDMGGIRELRGLVAQGDNNDQYTIETSLDGVHYQLAWIVPFTEVGQGLRTRSVELPRPINARYVRLKPKSGDNYYSISEVQAYCKLKPGFPPVLRVPPKKYGWDAIDNDGMVAIKGILASIATLIFGLAWLKRFREARLRSVALRALYPGLLLLAAISCAALGYIAGHGEASALTTFAKTRGSVPGWYYSGGMFAACGLALLALSLRRGGPRIYDMLMATIGVLSFLSWWNIGHYHFDHYIHTWEHYHYIIGAKYGPELRYSRLYQCTAVADVQDGRRSQVRARKMRRIESDNELGTTAEILAHPELCLSHFRDPARFEQFKKDVRFFRSQFGKDRWDQSQQDHGYNATPVWAIVGRLISDRVELTWDNIVKLGMIDSGYLIAMWLAVLWAFGWRTATVALLYWGANFPARFYWNGGSFLRYDWILWMVVGLCFLRKKHNFLGGVALTYGTLLRVFPGFLIATLVLKALAAMVRERRIFLSREHIAFGAGCVIALATMIPASSWATNGLDAWPEFAHNSQKHLKTALTNNMGFKTVMGYDFDTRAVRMRNDKLEDPFQDWKDAKQYFYAKRAPFMYAILLLFMIMLARAADREEEDWAAACLGAGLIVMAAELTCYYWGFLLTYGLLWERRKLPGVLSAAYAAFTCFIYAAIAWNDDHFAAMSLAAVVVAVAVTAQAAFGKRVRTIADEDVQLPPVPPASKATTKPGPLEPSFLVDGS